MSKKVKNFKDELFESYLKDETRKTVLQELKNIQLKITDLRNQTQASPGQNAPKNDASYAGMLTIVSDALPRWSSLIQADRKEYDIMKDYIFVTRERIKETEDLLIKNTTKYSTELISKLESIQSKEYKDRKSKTRTTQFTPIIQNLKIDGPISQLAVNLQSSMQNLKEVLNKEIDNRIKNLEERNRALKTYLIEVNNNAEENKLMTRITLLTLLLGEFTVAITNKASKESTENIANKILRNNKKDIKNIYSIYTSKKNKIKDTISSMIKLRDKWLSNYGMLLNNANTGSTPNDIRLIDSLVTESRELIGLLLSESKELIDDPKIIENIKEIWPDNVNAREEYWWTNQINLNQSNLIPRKNTVI